jgi:hypothetical protein
VESTDSELKLTPTERETPAANTNGQRLKLTPTERESPTITVPSPVRETPEPNVARPNILNRLQAQRAKLAVQDPALPSAGEVHGHLVVSDLDNSPLVVNPITVKHAQGGTAWADPDGDRSVSPDRP